MKLAFSKKLFILMAVVFSAIFLFLMAGMLETLVQGKGFLFIPSRTYTITASWTPTKTATLTSTPTITQTHTATVDIAQIKTNAVQTAEADISATARAQTLTFSPTATNTPQNTPDIQSSVTMAIQIYKTGIAQTETAIPPTGTPDTIVNANGYLMKRIGEDQSWMIQIISNGLLFWIDQTEVTFSQYERCVAAKKCASLMADANLSRITRLDMPAVNLTWIQAADYCTWAGKQLPSGEFWQIAAGNEFEIIYPWGNEKPDETLLNADKVNSAPLPVGSYPSGASPYGVLDMTGNVWEWVAGAADEADNPDMRYIRGGSWRTAYSDIAVSLSGSMRMDETADDVGFRCVFISD